jgi:hypothetical protein
MKANEVRLWINYHRELFPEWKYAPEAKAARDMAFNAICKALAKIDVEHAKESSDRMLAGTVKRPFRDEDVVAAIVAEAGRVRSQRYAQDHPRVDGQATVACPYCEDTGWVDCWRRDLVHQMAVVCSCPRGTPIAEVLNRERRQVQRYDPMKCYRVGDKSEHWAGIRRQRQADIAAGVEPLADGRVVPKDEYERIVGG